MQHPAITRVLRAVPVAVLALSLLAALPSCSDSGSGPGDVTPQASSLGFRLNGSTQVSFTGEGAWPASGTGVLARMDSAGKVLQVAAYRQTAGKAGAGPEARFTMLFLQVEDASGIGTGLQVPSIALYGEDLTIGEVDSLAYFGISGSFSVTSLGMGRVRGTFAGIAMRETDSAVVVISGGNFDAALGNGLLSFSDTSVAPATIAVTADTGTAPVYGWTGGPVYALGVARAAAPTSLVWGIVTAGGDSIGSGVLHGQVPAGAIQVAGTEPLLAGGVIYRVTVRRVDGSWGSADFVP